MKTIRFVFNESTNECVETEFKNIGNNKIVIVFEETNAGPYVETHKTISEYDKDDGSYEIKQNVLDKIVYSKLKYKRGSFECSFDDVMNMMS